MVCPKCGIKSTMVVNSRQTKRFNSIWRRRKCAKCKFIFTTYETINPSNLIVVKKNEEAQQFQSEKLFASIFMAIMSGKNQDKGEAASLANKITKLVELEIVAEYTKQLTSKGIFNKVVEHTKKRHPNVALRYISYHSNIREAKRLFE